MDVYFYNTMISDLTMHGRADEAIHLFGVMAWQDRTSVLLLGNARLIMTHDEEALGSFEGSNAKIDAYFGNSLVIKKLRIKLKKQDGELHRVAELQLGHPVEIASELLSSDGALLRALSTKLSLFKEIFSCRTASHAVNFQASLVPRFRALCIDPHPAPRARAMSLALSLQLRSRALHSCGLAPTTSCTYPPVHLKPCTFTCTLLFTIPCPALPRPANALRVLEPVFLPPAENRNSLFLHPAENRNNLPSPGREPQQSSFTQQRTATHSSFTRQRTATIFLHPAENRNTLPYPAENRYPFSPLPGEGREPGTMLMYSTRKPPEMMGRDLEKIRRSSLLGNLCLSFCSHSKAEKPLQSLLFLPFSPLHGDGREPVFLPPAENRNSLFLHPAENRNNLPSPGREPQQSSFTQQRTATHSSFTRQRTATIFLHPAENRNTLPYPAENRYPFSPLPGEGREPGTMLMYSTRKPPEMMGRDLEKIRRSSLLGNLCLSFCSHSKAEKPLQSLLFLPFSPLHGDGREPVFLPPAENRNSLFLHPAENRNNLPSPGREPQQSSFTRQRTATHSSFTRQRTATIFLHPAENRNTLPYLAENRYPFSSLPGESREPGTMLMYSTRKPPEMMGRDLEKIRRSSLLGNLYQFVGLNNVTPCSVLFGTTAWYCSVSDDMDAPDSSLDNVGPSGGFPAGRRAFRWWSGRTSGLQVVVRHNVRPLGGGPGGRRAFRWWSGGGSAKLRLWSRRSKGARAISDLSLDPFKLSSIFKENGGSIYKFSRVAWLVNRWEIKGKRGVV
ncbi:hypothetical protein M5K25_023021 [Dendrobium thyrsiflorum]|uniref:Pentatricopeptide repeat-containing protein n=1 Tax=Dendrobium thyrsiflorum TaxID=117978 RepID=A0ABD0U7R0_DENTH